MYVNWIALVFSLCFLGSLHAQDLNFSNYNTANGLPSMEVHDLYQDKLGYLWIATDRGLCRFDGQNFETYGLADGLTSTVILGFHKQANGEIWCNTMNRHIFQLRAEEVAFVPYKHNSALSKASSGRLIEEIVFDSNGHLFLSTDSGSGCIQIDQNGKVVRKMDELNLDNVTIEDGKYNVKRYNEYFLIFENHQGNTFSYIDNTKPDRQQDSYFVQYEIASEEISNRETFHKDSIHVYASGSDIQFYSHKRFVRKHELPTSVIEIGAVNDEYWFSTRGGGVYMCDALGNIKRHHLEGETVTSIIADHEGGFWMGTLASGVFYVPVMNVQHWNTGSKVSVDNITKYQNDIWVNTQTGKSYLVNASSSKLKYQSELGSYGLFEMTKTGGIWYTGGAEIRHFRSDVSQYETFKGVWLRKIGDDGDLPLLINGKLIFTWNDTLQYYYPDKAYDLFDASYINDSCIWIGTGDGLTQFNLNTQRLMRFQDGSIDVAIPDIDRIDDQTFIAGSKGRGVFLLNRDKVIRRFTKKDGLLSEIITEVYIEDDKNFWICTHLGLNRIRKVGGKYAVDAFTIEDGLSSNDVRDVLVMNDTVWVATTSGLDYFPVSLLNYERPKTKVFLELLSITVNDKLQPNLVDLSYKENKLDFFFKAISFRYKDQLRYRYKMIGLEDDWNFTEEQRVSYKSLPPGSYELVIQAGVDGYWYPEEIRKKVYIAQPYYATWQFILAIIAFSILIIYLFFRFRILSYNRYIIQEILRQIQRRLRMQDDTFIVRTDGSDVKVDSNQVFYAKAQGNYVELHTETGKLIIRAKISEFVNLVPDPNEYLQISRSTVIRKDKVTRKSKKLVVINEEEVKIGSTYKDVYDQLYL